MTARIVRGGRLYRSDQRGRFGRSNLAQVLVEEVARRQRHALDRSAVVLAHRHIVDIALEDLVLAEPKLDDERSRELAELARETAFVAIHEGARELLGYRTGALT